MVACEIIVNVEAGDVFFVEQHQVSCKEQFVALRREPFAQAQVFEVGFCRDKDIFNLANREEAQPVQVFRVSDQADVHLSLPQKLHRLEGRLALYGEADVRVGRDKFF